MNKSVIIIISALWAVCTLYYTLTRAYGFPHTDAARIGSWVASALLLICLVIYARKHSK